MTAARSIFFAGVFALATSLLKAAPPSPATVPTSKPAFAAGWDTPDDRLVFLMTQLASVETSMDAITKQLRITKTAQAGKTSDAAAQRKGNELMDRNMGMPTTIRWEKFYGRTADKFFYHPVDRSTSYHTLTVLQQKKADNTDDKPDANGGVPVMQRPPQFDYIYRANNERRAIAEADAAKLAGKVDQLTARRRDLEAEQAKLWCQISARAVAYRDLLSSKLYRFDVKANDAADLSTQRLATFRAAVHFLRVANRLMVDADASNEVTASTYTQTVKATLGKARAELDDALVKQPLLALDVTEVDTWIGKLTAVARRMDDLSRNVGDSNRLALDGDQAGDDQRKQTFRQSLQDQLLILAEGVLAGDECVTAMRVEWKLEFDGTQPLAAIEMPKVEVAARQPAAATGAPDRPQGQGGLTPTELPPTTHPPQAAGGNHQAVDGFRRISLSINEDGMCNVSVTPTNDNDNDNDNVASPIGARAAVARLPNAAVTRDGAIYRVYYDFASPATSDDFRPDNNVTRLRADPDALTVLLTKKDAFPSFGFPRFFRAPLSVTIDAARNKASHAVTWKTAAGVSINLDAFVEGNTLSVSRSVNGDWKNRSEKTANLDSRGAARLKFSVTEFAPRASPLSLRWFGQKNEDFRLRSLRVSGVLIGGADAP